MQKNSNKDTSTEILNGFKVWSDKPISSAIFFNFQEYSKALATIIQRKNTDTPLTIGIFGDWGSGKTSLMKTIESRLNGLYFIDEFENFYLDNLAMKLKDKNPVSSYCLEQFSPEMQKSFSNLNKTNISNPFRIKLVEELNKLITNPQFFNKQAFKNVNLSESTKKLLLKHSHYFLPYEEMINLNRLLLNDAYEIENHLKKEQNVCPIKTIWFNAWKYDKEDVLWRALLMRILEEMKISEKLAVQENSRKKWLDGKIAPFIQKLRNNWHFNINDIKNLDQLVLTLTDEGNPQSSYLMKKLSPDLKNLLQDYVLIDEFDTLKTILIKELNQLIIKESSIKDHIGHLHLNNTAKELLQQDPQGNKLSQLNWVILKQALFSDVVDKEIDNFNNDIECLQKNLYQNVYREELGGIEIEPKKAIKGTIKLGLSAIPAIGRPVTEILKVIDNESAFNELLESVQRQKKTDFIERIQFMEQFQQKFEIIIKNYHRNKRVVIFIDDLDRCLPEKAIEILESIKLFLDVGNCIIILGVDKRVISKSMEVKYRDFLIGENKEIPIFGDNYLEKFIQLGFKLPLISDKNIEEYITSLKVPNFYKPFLKMILIGIENNPRKIKRFFNVIELHRKLAYSLEEITKSLGDSENIKNRFNALLVEWQIISQLNPDFRKVVEDNPEILAILHEYLKLGDMDKITENLNEINKELSEMVLKDTKLLDLIKIFDYDTSEGNFINDIKLVVYLSSFTPPMTDKGEEEGITINTMSPSEINEAIEGKYLFSFSWDRIPGNDNENLIKFLKQKFGINWDETAKIEKIDNGNAIKVSTEMNNLSLNLNPEKTEVIFKIDDVRTDKFIAKIENGNLNIYEYKILIGRNMKEADLTGKDLSKMNLSGANLSKAILNDANLMEANLQSANLREAQMERSRLNMAKINDANLTRANLYQADLTEAQLEGSDLRYANLSTTKLCKANLQNAKLKDSLIFSTDMEDANLSGADLTGAGLMTSHLTGVKFKDAILNNVNLKGSKFDDHTDFRGAEINSVTIDHLKGTNWDDALWDPYLKEEIEKKGIPKITH